VAQTHKRIGQAAPSAVTPLTLYVAPAATTTIISEFAICNTSIGQVDSFNIFIVPMGDSPGTANAICYSVPIASGNPCFLNIAQTLNTGDSIVIESANGLVTFTCSGLEIT
jgi:hypothetical protein